MNKIPLVDLKAQMKSIRPEVDEAIARILDNTSFIMGKEVADFETAFASYCKASRAAGVASGTAALHLALYAAGVGQGDEVITTSHTFLATAEAISMVGAVPVLVDIEEDTYNINPECVAKAITPRTKAILPVHLYGHPADMPALRRIADEHGLVLIEDAAQAHGAEMDGERVGSMGDLACFSFYPGKNLGAFGDGGAVTGNDETLMDKVAMLRNHGRCEKYLHSVPGFGERLDAIQAAILGVKLPKMEDWTEARRSNAAAYNSLLADTDVILPVEREGARHVYHLYVIRIEDRERILNHLHENGVGAGVHYPVPVHLQPAYADLGMKKGSLPVTERICNEIISLPMFPELSHEQITTITTSLKKAL